MPNNKILYFDYWTIGIRNFQFFDDKLKEKGYETMLFHLNSWRGVEGPEFQTLSGIDCYDIRYYKTNVIFNVLRKEMPAVVIMLNASLITDRTVILACKTLGIKCVFLAHGSLLRNEFIDSSIESMRRTAKKGRFVRAAKHLKGTVLNYLYALGKYHWRYLFHFHPYKVLLNTFRDPAKYLFFPPHTFDLEPDLILVYGNAERLFFEKRLKDNARIVKVTGMPDLDTYFQQLPSLGKDREAFLRKCNIPLDKPYITYIEEGMMVDKIWSPEYSQAFFATIAKSCTASGFHLVIKLHPRTAKSQFRSIFDELKNTTVLDNVDFPKLIYFTNKCISHFSTTLIYPILLNKPVLIPRWGNSANLLKSFSSKEVTYVHSIEEFEQSLKIDVFSYDRSEYLRDFVPFTDGKTSDRIANYILEVIK